MKYVFIFSTTTFCYFSILQLSLPRLLSARRLWGHWEWHCGMRLFAEHGFHIWDTCPLGPDILLNKRTLKGWRKGGKQWRSTGREGIPQHWGHLWRWVRIGKCRQSCDKSLALTARVNKASTVALTPTREQAIGPLAVLALWPGTCSGL